MGPTTQDSAPGPVAGGWFKQLVGEVYLLEIHQLYTAKLADFTGNPTSNRIY